MNYPNKTVTNAGASLIASTNGTGIGIVIDKAIISDKLPSNYDIDDLDIDNFADAKTMKIDTVKNYQNTTQPEVTLHNDDLTQDYPVNMIGLLAHASDDKSGNETLYIVATANDDPFIMPKKSATPFSLTFALPFAVSNSDKVTINVTEAGSPSVTQFNSLNSEVSSLSNNVGSDVSNEMSNATSEMNSLLPKIKILEGQTPATPTLQAVMSTNNNTLHYSIIQPSKHDAGEVYQYHVYYKLTTNQDYKEVDNSNTTGSIPNLDATKEYNVYVVAENAAGLSDKSNTVETGKANVPNAPSLKASMDTSNATISYTITAPSNNGGANITDYQLFYKKVNDQNYNMIDCQTNLTGKLNNLDPQSKYNLYTQAINLAGVSQPSNTATTDVIDGNIYGAKWQRGSDPSLTRTDAAVGMFAGVNGDRNDFDNAGVWKQIHPVYDSKNNKFIRVPLCYLKKTQTGSENNGTCTWQVSLKPFPGCYTPKCFIDYGNNKNVMPYVDVGAYVASDDNNGGLSSISGKPQLDNVDINDFRNKARNVGRGYQLIDMHVVDLLQTLFTIEFATLNSQHVVNDQSNITNYNTGVTDNDKGSTNLSDDGVVCYRGIENLWGQFGQWIDGVNFNNGQVWVCDDPSQYSSDTFAYPYYQIGYNENTNSGWVSSMNYDPNNPDIQFPQGLNGNGSDFYCDYYSGSSGAYVAFLGYSSGSGDGLWFWCLDSDSSDSYSGIGSRLIKRPVA